MKKGICKLCGDHKNLLKQSHIYPSFIYKGVFDETRRTVLASLKDDRGIRYYQTGFYDKNVLCEHCDNVIIGRLERFAASVLPPPTSNANTDIFEQIENDQLTTLHITGMDYKQLKLFVLSLLWRAHHSNNNFFQKVHIPNHEPILRKMILEGAPGPETLYEMAIVRIDRPNGAIVDMIPTPEVGEGWKLDVALFIIGGLVFAVGLRENLGFKLFPDFSLKSSNQIRLPRLKGGAARSFLTALGIPEDYANYYTGSKIDSF
ncbi:MAG: hypothetical protein EOO45_01145 [Flavobacterium sp.]|nr:MAG: hypothetical protein EOO45_01145 [Flavobacterium sp.]